MVRLTNALAVLLLIALCAGLSACEAHAHASISETVSGDKVAEQVKSSLSDPSQAASATVTCGDLDVKVGATDDCDLTIDGARTGVHLTVDRVDDGHVHWTQRPFLHGEDLAKFAARKLGAAQSALTCPQIDGIKGQTVSCKVNQGSATSVQVTVTSVQGLLLGLHIKTK